MHDGKRERTERGCPQRGRPVHQGAGLFHDQEGMVPIKVLFADFREWQGEAGMTGLTLLNFESGVRGVTGSSRHQIETGGKRQFVIAGLRKDY